LVSHVEGVFENRVLRKIRYGTSTIVDVRRLKVNVGHKFPSTITCTKLTVHYQNSKCFDQIPRSSRGSVPDTRGYNFIHKFKNLNITPSIDLQQYDYSHITWLQHEDKRELY